MSPRPRQRRRSTANTDSRLTVIRGDGRTVYRLCDDPDLLDPWISDYEADRRPRPPQRANALIHMGLSMWTTLAKAQEANERQRTPFDGAAEVRLDGNKGIWSARTFGPGHLTVWGRPEDLQDSLGEVHPV